jgi:hypothetical protein
MKSIGRIVLVCVAISLAVLTRSGASAQVAGESPRLFVLLEPAGPQFVPLEDRSRIPAHGTSEKRVYNFVVMAIDRDHPPEKPLAFATGVVSPGETRKVLGGRGNVQVRGTVSVTAPAMAKYEAELLIAGTPAASSGAFLNFGMPK